MVRKVGATDSGEKEEKSVPVAMELSLGEPSTTGMHPTWGFTDKGYKMASDSKSARLFSKSSPELRHLQGMLNILAQMCLSPTK